MRAFLPFFTSTLILLSLKGNPSSAAGVIQDPALVRMPDLMQTALTLYHTNLSHDQRHQWRQFETSSTPEREFQYTYVAWRMDSDYSLQQSISWAMHTQDAEYLQETLFVVAQFRDHKTGFIPFHKVSTEGVGFSRLELTRLQKNILTIGDYQFLVKGTSLIAWRKPTQGSRYETFSKPIPLPTLLLNSFLLQA